MTSHVNIEKKKLLNSFYVPIALIIVMYALMWIQWYFSISLTFLGVHPLHKDGLIGIFTSVFIHGSWGHLLGNTIPFFIFASGLYYFYPKISNKILIGLWLTSGLYLWLFARDNWHIGASGLVYSLAFFHIVISIIQREMRLTAFSMLIIFLYGSMLWGFFPEFFPKENISWQGHLMGAIVGVIFALFFYKQAPTSEEFFTDEDENDDEEDPYWMNGVE